MNLAVASKSILSQLAVVIDQIDHDDFIKPIPLLNNSTIGQHIRHTLEFFICLKNGIEQGIVDYDNRDHDAVIETDKILSMTVIEDLNRFIDEVDVNNNKLTLRCNYSLENDASTSIDTNLNRELAYNIEHAIHHMAIIKIGLKSIADYVEIPENFGVAISTIKYRNQTS